MDDKLYVHARLKDTSRSLAWKVNQERKTHRDQRPEREDVDSVWGTKCVSSFGGGWAPSDHNAQGLGSRNGRLAFRSPCQYPQGDGRISAEEKHWVRSEPKWQSHKAAKQTQKVDGSSHWWAKGRGPPTECECLVHAQHCVSRFTAVETASVCVFSLLYPLCLGLCMHIKCLLNEWRKCFVSEKSHACGRGGFHSLHFIHEWVGWGGEEGKGDGGLLACQFPTASE